MYCRGKTSYQLSTAIVFILAAMPAHAQTSASSQKQDMLGNNPLATFPTAQELQQATLGTVQSLSSSSGAAPGQPASAAGAPPAGTGSTGGIELPSGATMQAVLQGLRRIEDKAEAQKPALNQPSAPADQTAPTTPFSPAAMAAEMQAAIERLRQKKQDAVLAAAASVRREVIAGTGEPANIKPAPPGMQVVFAPLVNSKEDAQASLLKQPDVVAAVRDMTVTAAMRNWDDAFAAAWPDYAANNAYHPSIFFAGHYGGDALAVMPDGSTVAGSLSIYVDFVDNIVDGGMNFASPNPNLVGNLTFTEWFMGDWGEIEDSAAFGGALSNGEWSGGYYGAAGDIMAGQWSATVTGGPNAGVVIGRFGGTQ